MSSDLNNWRGIGRLGADPEVRYLPDGTAVCNFTVACSDRWKDKQTGQQQERTEWVRCVAFGPQAEFLGEWLRKGARVHASGQLRTRKWQGQDGQNRYTTEIHLDRDTQIIDWPERDQQAPRQQTAPRQQQRPAPQPSQQAAPPQYDDFDDSDDIPF